MEYKSMDDLEEQLKKAIEKRFRLNNIRINRIDFQNAIDGGPHFSADFESDIINGTVKLSTDLIFIESH